MANALRKSRGPNPVQQSLGRLNGIIQPYHSAPVTGMHYGEQAKYVTWKFDPAEFRSIELLHMTDFQFGHIECRVHRIIEYRDWILSKPNRFVLFGGDMIDASTVMSPGEPWENIAGPQRQVYKFCELVAPMRHRILGYVGGNHERRGIRTFGDLGVLIAYLLRIPYSGGQQLIDIHYGAHRPFKVSLWHGGGAARTKGSKAQMLARFMESGDSQLYLVGHLHDLVLLGGWRNLRKPGHNDIHIQKIMGGMSTSFLSYWGTYAEVAGLTVSDVAMIRAVLGPDGGWECTIR